MKINNNILETIKKSNKVAIFCHTKPDSDALGSSSAMKLMLEQMGKNCDMYCESEIPITYSFLPNINKVKRMDFGEHYDLGICLDCSDRRRMGECAKIFDKCDTTIKIDHHATCEDFAKYNQVELVGSTCEILFYLLQQLDLEMNKDIACALYSGVSSDTGCFMHDSTTSDTHRIASELLKFDIDMDKIHYYLFRRRTKNQLELLRCALSNITFELDDNVAIMYLTLKDFEKCNAQESDTLGFVNNISNVETARVAVMLSEEKRNLYAASFRTNGSVDVSKIAEAFGGGGHKMAAGAKIYGSIGTVKRKIIEVCKEFV